jgi:hypothetical protein
MEILSHSMGREEVLDFEEYVRIFRRYQANYLNTFDPQNDWPHSGYSTILNKALPIFFFVFINSNKDPHLNSNSSSKLFFYIK